ncbi:6-phospho-beta-glucosidase [Clostridium sp. YIM B02515]|uniref:6-phospho-beta-glucosidase n=1 Tax=Clostridium rhizosphaerae TaxID=2803861 RepID=A0ABS1TEP5_9CLOT|nr:6-phospho-beta-glucosidase [Clostridium rhizosphaerae]MBL4937832.1 6-phospho-beta-glucosidase [Clostridium rhizosphaerae]
MKITVIGAGSSYCPEIAMGLIQRKEIMQVDEIALMDIDEYKLQIVGNFFQRIMKNHGLNTKITITSDLQEAVKNADFIITQIRVGKMDARINDEKIPLKYNLIGQETTGIGGFFCALRTIEAMEKIAETIEQFSPNAWLINFANPSGIVTEYFLKHTKVKAIGLCNVPITIAETIGDIVGCDYHDLQLESIGLNHLSYITAAYLDGKDVLEQVLKSGNQGPTMANMKRIEIDTDLLRLISAIPSSYLGYYNYRSKKLEELKNEKLTRGEECKLIEEKLMEYYSNEENIEVPEMLNERGGHLYSEAAVSLIESLHTNNHKPHVVNVCNRGVIPFLLDDDVVEVSCFISRDGAESVPLTKNISPASKSLMQSVKLYERLTVQAAVTGDKDTVYEALMAHPLIGDFEKIKPAVEEMLQVNIEYLPKFKV